MIDSTAARQTMLSKVRGLNLDGVDSESISLEYAAVPRSYQRSGLLNAEQRVDLLEERLVEYDAHVHRVTPSTLPRAIAEAVNRRGAQRIAIPDGIPANWITPAISVVEAESLSNVELDTFDGLLSGCTVAIALTGTIVLQHAPAQGPRKLSLIPDYHLCVVSAGQVVETVPEAFDRLAATATLPTTFISGPSATADIEMTRIKGVHGPRFLEVLIVC